MPRKQTYCARGPGHPPPCATPEAMQRQRQRTAASRPTRVITSEDRVRWNRAYKLKIKGLTLEKFQEMLEAQCYACAMCHEPFEEDQQIFADHDHACCRGTRSCGKCLRGLLHLKCNVAVGYVETYGDMVRAYLSRPRQPGSAAQAARGSGLGGWYAPPAGSPRTPVRRRAVH